MARVLVIVPFPFEKAGLDNRRAQLGEVKLGADIEFDYVGVKAGPASFDSYHDDVLAHVAILEAGLEAQHHGYDAVCIDTMSDSGVNALRSLLDIPVIGPGKASCLVALMLGTKFSILLQWDAWIRPTARALDEHGLAGKCASIRSIDSPPDVEKLLAGRAGEIFPRLLEKARQCLGDGADVICLGSTTMHEAHGYLADNLPVPVINPGPLTYKLAEMMLSLNLTQSRLAYPKPSVPKAEMLHAMMAAATAIQE